MSDATDRLATGRWAIAAAALLGAFAVALLPLSPLDQLPVSLRAALAILMAFIPSAWIALRAETDSAVQRKASEIALKTDSWLTSHEQLDHAIDSSLALVIDDTETSAIAIMQELQGLHDAAATLVQMLVDSRQETERLETEIANGLSTLASMREQITNLPGKISSNLGQVRAVSEQIQELNGLAELVQAISTQSHLLAINAAIEAHRAGEQGRTFRVVANEVKRLAADSGRAATEIGARLSSAWRAVESGMQSGVDESLVQLQQIAQVAESISALEQKYLAFSAYYRAQFAAVTEHNESLASDIVDALGRAQYQDVVRQAIERVRSTVRRRNEILSIGLDAPEDEARAASSLALLRDEFEREELRHSNADRSRDGVTETGELTIELF